MFVNRTASKMRCIQPAVARCYSGTRPVAFASKKEAAAKDKQERVGKKDLIQVVAEQHEMSKAKAERIINTVIESIASNVADNKMVVLQQFGTFRMMRSKARTCVVPNTDRTVDIPERNRLKFKASKSLLTTIQTE